MKLKALLPLMLIPPIALAEEYHSFSNADYSRTEIGPVDFDEFTIGTAWYFANRVTLGPLKEFEYINRTSNVFGSWTRIDGTDGADTVQIGGEYFAGNVLLGGSAANLDGTNAFTGTLGYLFSSNFLVSLAASKTESFDTNYFINVRYNHQLHGSDYIGFNLSTDEEFDTQAISSRYFTGLAGEKYLAAELSYTFSDNGEDSWALQGDYYLNRRTSLGLGIAKHEVYTLDFSHFFTENFAIGLNFTTRNDDSGFDLDVDVYRLGMTLQF